MLNISGYEVWGCKMLNTNDSTLGDNFVKTSFAYNSVLVEAMSMFSDSVWMVDLNRQQVAILHDRINTEDVGRVYSMESAVNRIKGHNHPDEAAILERFNIEFFKGIKKAVSYEDESFKTGGRRYAFRCVYTPEFDENGDVSAVYISFVNTQSYMDKQYAQDTINFGEKLTTQENMFREQMEDIIESSDQQIIIVEAGTFKLLYANKAALTAYSVDEAFEYTGGKCYECFAHKDKPCDFCPVFRLGDGEDENVFETYTGYRYLSVHIKKTVWNGKLAYIEYISDISAKKKAEQALRVNKDTLAGTNMGSWNLLFGEGEPKLYMDENMAELTGISLDETPEAAFVMLNASVAPEEKERFDRYSAQLIAGELSEVEYRFIHPTKGEIFTRCFGKAVADYQGAGILIRGYHQDITKHKKELDEVNRKLQIALAEAEESSAQYREFLEIVNDLANSGMWYIYFDEKHEYEGLTCNNTMRHMLGYNDENDLPNDLSLFVEAIYPDDRKPVWRAVEEAVAGSRVFEMEYRVVCKDGSVKWVAAKGATINNVSGAPRLLLGTIVDVTEKKQNENDFNERMAVILDNVEGGLNIRRLEAGWPYDYVSEGLARLQGYTVEEFLKVTNGSPVDNTYPEDIDNVLTSYYAQTAASDYHRLKYRVRHKNGELLWINDYGKIVTALDGRKYIYSFVENITEAENSRIQLELEREQFRNALLKNAIMHFSMDLTDGIIREEPYWNSGKPAISSMGASVPIAFNDFVEKILLNGVEFENETRDREWTREGLLELFERGITECNYVLHNINRDKYYQARCLLFKHDSNGHIFSNFIFTDITEKRLNEIRQKKMLEDALSQAEQASKAKSQFLSNMSHDIRTPMNAIMGMTQIAIDHSDDRERVDDCLNKIQISSEHLLSLINDVLDMSKLEAGEVSLPEEPVDFNELFEQCIVMVEPMAKNVGVEMIIDGQKPQHPYIISSALHLRQIIVNMASNGIKYNKPGGNLEMKCTSKLMSSDVVEYTFEFNDTGIGMSADFIDKIFEPFSQEAGGSRTTYEGTGLGLAIVKSLVDKMGGKISVTSEKGVGSRFTLVIPFKIDKSPVGKMGETVERAVDLSGIKILLVEDNDFNLQLAQMLLEESGATVETAKNGREAVDFVVNHSSDAFDIILMDVRMPVMDGYEATKAIRTLDDDAKAKKPIVAMTANVFAEDKKQAIDSGMNGHISKPLDMGVVVSTILDKINGV